MDRTANSLNPLREEGHSSEYQRGRVSQFILYQSGMLSVVITTLFVWPFLGRVLNQSRLGDLSLQLAIASILAPALACGAHLYLANRLAGKEGGRRRLEVQTAVALTCALYAISLIALISSAMLSSTDIPLSLSLSSAIAAYLVTSGVMRGTNKPVMFAVFMFAVQVCGLVGLGLGTSAYDDLRMGVAVYVMLIGLPVTVQLLTLRRHMVGISWAGIVRTLRRSSTLVPHLVLSVALLMMMRVLVSFQLGSEAVANYTFASLVIGGCVTIAASLDAHWSVRAQASVSLESLGVVLARNQVRTQFLLLGASVGAIAFLFIALEIWLPQGYDRGGVMVAVVCALPSASLQAIADGRAALLMWKNRPGMISLSTVAGTTTAFVLAFWLMPEFGWAVIGVCLTVGMSIRALLTYVCARATVPKSRIGGLSILFLLGQFLCSMILFLLLHGPDRILT